jgi:thiamine biosynthesis protein ThiS
VRIVVDGLPEDVPDGANVLDVLKQRGEPTTHIIVEINGAFVHPQVYGEKRVHSGDRMEVVYPAFGG